MAEPTADDGGNSPYQRTPQGTRQDAASPAPERVLWKGHPAFRSTFYQWVIAALATWGIAFVFPWLVPVIVSVAEGIANPTEAQIADIVFWSHAIYALPALIVLVRMVSQLLTSYELTSQRLILRTGLLVRRRNEVALHRIRDYEVVKPIYWGILGLGYIVIISRDEALPTVTIGPVPRTTQVIDQIRDAAFAYKREMGYREFESW